MSKIKKANSPKTVVKQVYASISNEKNKRRRKPKESYGRFIYKILRQVHPDAGISSKGMSIMTSMVNDLFEKIATEASRLRHIIKSRTLTSREIQSSVRLLVPGELSIHAISEGTKAVTKYRSAVSQKSFVK